MGKIWFAGEPHLASMGGGGKDVRFLDEGGIGAGKIGACLLEDFGNTNHGDVLWKKTMRNAWSYCED
jgi:hypothetical protein